MAEIVGSAVVQESVSKILSGAFQKYEEKQNSNAFRNIERLEMAHIRLEAVLQTSDKWDITDTSLLRWRRKLKCAAHECNNTLHRCMQRIRDDDHREKEVSNFSLPKRAVHATRSFVSSIFNHDNNDFNRSVVQRFEWYADGASEFLRLLELGGTPRCRMPFDTLIRHLLAGKILQLRITRSNKCPLFLLLAPFIREEHGVECRLHFMQKDRNAPENNFFLGAMLQISESTDIVGTLVNCLQLFPPCFQTTVETIKKELTQLPTQDFPRVPYVDLWHRKHWDNIYSFCTQWFRPDPLCCKKQHGQNNMPWCTSNPDMVGIPDVSLDSVILMCLECQVSVSEYNYRQQTTTTSPYRHTSSTQDCSPYLKAGLLFTPHGRSTKHRVPEEKNSAVVTVYGEEQDCLHIDITLDQLNEIMLPKATDYFYRNPEATACQMLWKSRHGTEYIEFEKPWMEEMPCAARRVISMAGSRKRKLQQVQGQQEQVQVLGSWNGKVACFLNSWVAHAPVQLRGLILDWLEDNHAIGSAQWAPQGD